MKLTPGCRHKTSLWCAGQARKSLLVAWDPTLARSAGSLNTVVRWSVNLSHQISAHYFSDRGTDVICKKATIKRMDKWRVKVSDKTRDFKFIENIWNEHVQWRFRRFLTLCRFFVYELCLICSHYKLVALLHKEDTCFPKFSTCLLIPLLNLWKTRKKLILFLSWTETEVTWTSWILRINSYKWLRLQLAMLFSNQKVRK